MPDRDPVPWRLGLGLPNAAPGVTAETIASAARAAADRGWDDVWVADHVLVDHAASAQYGHIYEALTTLAYVAGANPTLRVGTAVLVVPQRNAVVLAKEIASLDALTGGRLTVGVGVGREPAEYRNLGSGDRFHVRGAALDDAIRLWRHLWSGTSDPFDGRYSQLDDFVFGPVPAQGASLPILVGGKSEAAIRRSVVLGDGHLASQTSPDELRERIARLAAIAAEAGLPPSPVAVRVGFTADEIVGSDLVKGRLTEYLEAGATHLIVGTGLATTAGLTRAVDLVTRVASALGWVPDPLRGPGHAV